METKRRNTWLVGDTHFDHMNMCLPEYCNRPEDFNQRIVCHWRKMVAPDDLIFHLGDVYFGKRSRFFDCVQNLPGTKILIKGNHDREKTDWYLNHGFTAVVDFVSVVTRTNMKERGEHFLYTRVLLSHKPMEIPRLEGYKTINIHGHFHTNPPEKCEGELVKLLTDDHYLFSLELTNYKPVLLSRAVRDNWVKHFDRKQSKWLD